MKWTKELEKLLDLERKKGRVYHALDCLSSLGEVKAKDVGGSRAVARKLNEAQELLHFAFVGLEKVKSKLLAKQPIQEPKG